MRLPSSEAFIDPLPTTIFPPALRERHSTCSKNNPLLHGAPAFQRRQDGQPRSELPAVVPKDCHAPEDLTLRGIQNDPNTVRSWNAYSRLDRSVTVVLNFLAVRRQSSSRAKATGRTTPLNFSVTEIQLERMEQTLQLNPTDAANAGQGNPQGKPRKSWYLSSLVQDCQYISQQSDFRYRRIPRYACSTDIGSRGGPCRTENGLYSTTASEMGMSAFR